MNIKTFLDNKKPSEFEEVFIIEDEYNNIDDFLNGIKKVIFVQGFSSTELFELWANGIYKNFKIIVEYNDKTFTFTDSDIDFINWRMKWIKEYILEELEGNNALRLKADIL